MIYPEKDRETSERDSATGGFLDRQIDRQIDRQTDSQSDRASGF